VLARALPNPPAAVGDEAVKQLQVRAQGANLLDDGRGGVARDDHVTENPGRRRICRRRGPGVARRGKRYRRRTQLNRPGDRHRQTTRLERAGRVLPLVLDQEPGDTERVREGGGLHKRRPPLPQRCHPRSVPHREHLGVSPEVGAPAREGVPVHRGGHRVQIVTRVEGKLAAGGEAAQLLARMARPAGGALEVGRSPTGGDRGKGAGVRRGAHRRAGRRRTETSTGPPQCGHAARSPSAHRSHRGQRETRGAAVPSAPAGRCRGPSFPTKRREGPA
jgi:hypothetical protein